MSTFSLRPGKRSAALGGEGGGEGAEGRVRMTSKRELTEEEFDLYCLSPETLFADYDADAVRGPLTYLSALVDCLLTTEGRVVAVNRTGS
jgi:hypothetical protein